MGFSGLYLYKTGDILGAIAIKYKVITYKYISSVLLVGILLFSGCSKELENAGGPNDTVSPIPQARTAKVYSGHHRLLFVWPEPDASVSEVRIYWNGREDSVAQVLTFPMDTLKISIDNLDEGEYAMEVLTFDNKGASSGKVLLKGLVYGESYVNEWDARVLYDMNYLHGSSSLGLVWEESTDSRIAGSEVWYTDASGTEHRKFISHTTLDDVLDNMPTDERGQIKYRTVYLPDGQSIDTLYGAFTETTYINRKAIFDNLPGWKFRCKVMVEAKTIMDHGGPLAFKDKMDDGLIRASRKFQVPGLNDAGNNEIHFYMTECIPFEGTSGQFRYLRGVDDPDMDILLIVNGNAASDDLSWGWLRTPYLTLGHDYPGLFGDSAIDALLHEFGHVRGMYDLYLGEVPNGANNPISGQPFESKRCIMNYPYGETVWSEFSRFIINESAGEKVAKFYWDYFPSSFHVDVKQKNGTVAAGAKLNFYPVFANSNAVRATDVVKYRATTGSDGLYIFPDNPYAIDGNISNNVYNYLVQIEYNGEKEYRWMPMDDALIAGSKGQPFIFYVELSN